MSVCETVETVLGSTLLSEIGITLTHEHVHLDFNEFYVPPPANLQSFLDNKINLKNVGYIKQYPYSNKYNLTFNDADSAQAVIEDVKSFYTFGGRTIVENSSHGLNRNIPLMVKISEQTGVNILAGTGYYVASVQNASTLKMTKEEMYNVMCTELQKGCIDYPKIKAGFIGEVGSSWPITDFEKRAICATGEIQEQLRCSVSFHPGRDKTAPSEIMRLYQEAGGNARRAIMSHVDRTLLDVEAIIEFAEAVECYCQFDLFGTECSFYQLNPMIDMPSDAQRMKCIARLKEEKQLHRVLLSHDIHTKHRLTTFGGHGYSHIMNNVVPVLKSKHFTTEEIELLTVGNPRTWLSQHL
ncbi:phosphotriesterase-related protein [Odontomachus brunneus]|uniref:phosphotriesterase-related protein n=1 Tax=Odontomachus brunneus TaxID=486640 RepID=UPI0013F28B61|nr:phosphotriesterase-related protein [Odontomachus brunneus]XP_032689981.1 phosphotriesterase-related protein [Odontomachus brunneus]XP_032689982.1 phosphotriesterase-related protein [Odontomachus brunneus]XP_032689983.1 phosphotriesterase-related protein [Odontomachus brunneus]XP_032689984.1 phosphotriesterase-related protein [Odontomachus brunneus]XP_032689985.1 phosphotriesterase-related protein [Odontomachus brunneus]XP_032689986.1 phosphotriesterase-related protein [Odontomachus brunneu